MAKDYTNYNDYLQDAYEQQTEKYANISKMNNERTQTSTQQ